MNTPTPETDALDAGLADHEWDEGYGVLLEHARNLECERDAAIKARNHNRVCVERLVDERDEYKKLLSHTLKSDMPVLERLLLERDQLRQLRDALLANQVFHTPIALRRRGGEWDEYEIDAINRTREALAATEWLANDQAQRRSDNAAPSAKKGKTE